MPILRDATNAECKCERYSEDTRYALTEMNNILRHLFPVVPDRQHLIWRTSALTNTNNIQQPPIRNNLNALDNRINAFRSTSDRIGQSIERQAQQVANACANCPNERAAMLSSSSVVDGATIPETVGPIHTGLTQLPATNQHEVAKNVMDAIRAEVENQETQQQPQLSPQYGEDSPDSALEDVLRSAEHTATQTGKSSSNSGSQLPVRLGSSNHGRTRAGSTSSSGGSQGSWRVSNGSPTLGKRGPECMRKCIAQGVLHPVQCHSLC